MTTKSTWTRSLSALSASGLILVSTACMSTSELSADAEPQGASGGIAFATLDQGSAWYNYGAAIGSQIEDVVDGAKVEVLPYSGGIGNPELIAQGEAQIATSFSAVTSWAYNGTAGTPFEEEPFDNLRVLVGGIDQYYFGPIAPANAKFESLDEIVDGEMGIDIVSQPRGSLGDIGTNMVLEAYGAGTDDVESWGGSFEPTSTDVATTAIGDRNADLWIQAITAGHPGITELAQTSDIKILPISDDAVEALSDYGLTAATLPGGTFRGQDDDVQLVGFNTSIIASADLDEETAYEITKAIIEGADVLAEANAGMAGFDPALAASEGMTSGVPLHPGAERYYAEAGLL